MRVVPAGEGSAAPAPLPKVAIVGRPNVGKSTLFNRLVRRRLAIVHPQPGVTRDRLEAAVTWRGHSFVLVDTGGLLDTVPREGVEGVVWQQASAAVQEASLLLLVVDVRDGVMALDRQLANWLRRSGKPSLLVVNKVDAPAHEAGIHEFAALGLGEGVPVSAASGRGVGELLDRILDLLGSRMPAQAPAPSPAGPPPVRIAIVGRPNVGKSSLVNAIVGQQRVAVDERPGTTRDAVDIDLEWQGRRISLVDTAGIRKRARPGARDVEQLAVARAFRAMSRSDVAIVLIDATEGVTFQEARLAGRAAELGLAVVLAVNKWDRIGRPDQSVERYVPEVRHAAGRLDWAPVHFISALEKWGIRELLQSALAAADRRARPLDPEIVQSCVDEAVRLRPPASPGRAAVRITGVRQVASRPPTLVLSVRGVDRLDDAYLRYLERQLRSRIDLTGTPVRWAVRPSAKRRPALPASGHS
ncbi:MAG: ribosome biogenesis GTPase Der [Limnochordaceae bacterium]|nr:ribosome biogenesis GTPase Der [Limnochordaceae bacterium]